MQLKLFKLGYYLLIITFAFSVYSKLHDLIDFNNFLSKIFSLNAEASFILTIIILSIEVYLLLQLILNSKSRAIYQQVISFLVLLTFILIYLLVLNYADNCFCFGLFLEMPPAASIAKNFFLIVIAYLISRKTEKKETLFIESSAYLLITSVLLFVIIDKPQNFFRNDMISKITVSQMNPSKQYLLIDARTELKYREKHIKNAINFPLIGTNIRAKVFESQLEYLNKSKNKNWLVYCDNEFCSLAQNLARQLKENYPDKQIYVLKGGIESWEKYGLALGSL